MSSLYSKPGVRQWQCKSTKAGRTVKIDLYSGASVGPEVDTELTEAGVIRKRIPYQTDTSLRKSINAGNVDYIDMHLGRSPEFISGGHVNKPDVALVEALAITEDGNLIPTTSVGNTPTYVAEADTVIVEIAMAKPLALEGMADIYIQEKPPLRKPVPITHAGDRIGTPYLEVDKKKVVGVVECNIPDEARAFKGSDPVTDQIGANVAQFLVNDMRRGIIPPEFLPLQSGVGSTANAILAALGQDKNVPDFNIYTEVLQNAIVDMMLEGRVKDASTCSLTVDNECLMKVYDNIDHFAKHLTIRQSEISNSPEVIRRLGVIAINTAIEVDIYGNANSTHISGTKMMNGIGGSGDFERNAYISIFTCPSVAKGGLISSIVPMVSHQDHSEHDVNVIITEQGIADLRGKSPLERAHTIIENCAHPDYRPLLREYLSIATGGHTHHNLPAAFAMHDTLRRKGDMHLTEFAEYVK